MVKIKESDMYEPLKKWFSSNGYEVYSEVEAAGRRADIICKKDNTITVIEMKTSINLDLIEQAYNWRYKANYIYVAVPLKTAHLYFARKLLQDAGIGMLLMDIDSSGSQSYCNRITIELTPHLFRKISIPWDRILLPEYRYNQGGSNNKHMIMSRYKIMMDHVRTILTRYPEGICIDELAKQISSYYTNPKSSLYNALTKYEKDWCEKFKDPNTREVKFRLTEKGRNGASTYLGRINYKAQIVELEPDEELVI